MNIEAYDAEALRSIVRLLEYENRILKDKLKKCDNRWDAKLCPKQRGEKMICDDCDNKKWTKLDVKKIVAHLLGYKEDGSDVIGIYPLLPDGTCRFIVFDFDNHEKGAEATDFANADVEWHKEVDALRKICEINGIHPLVERSRSGERRSRMDIFPKSNTGFVS